MAPKNIKSAVGRIIGKTILVDHEKGSRQNMEKTKIAHAKENEMKVGSENEDGERST